MRVSCAVSILWELRSDPVVFYQSKPWLSLFLRTKQGRQGPLYSLTLISVHQRLLVVKHSACFFTANER